MTENELAYKFNVFPTTASVNHWFTSWCASTNQGILPSLDEAFKAGQKHIKDTVDTRIQALLDTYSIEHSLILDYNFTRNLAANKQDDLKNIGTGAGVGLGLAALLGMSFFPVVAAGATVGGLWKRISKAKEFKERLLDISSDYARQCAKSIYEIIKLKTISDTLSIPPVIVTPPRTSSVQSLSLKQLQIKNFLDQRGIKYLLHFTSAENIESIKKHGILSVEELNRQGIAFSRNDVNRLDNELDYISLSITSINRQLLGSYIHTGRIKNVRVVWISASILYEEIDNPRIYCDRNAAATSCRKGTAFSDLQNMFLDTLRYTTTIGERDYDRTRDGRANNEPTDPQSEILFKGCIPTKYILDVKGTSYYGY